MTERSETERAELVALEAGLRMATFAKDGPTSPKILGLMVAAADALRSLAAQDQKPVAWRILCTDKSRGSTGYYYTEQLPFEPGENLRQRSEPVPLYLSPPPAAGWEDAIEACKQVQPSDFGPVQSKQPKVNVRELVEALRHNAPPDSGAGKSDDAGARISNLAADLVVSGWMASNAQDVERHKKEAEQKLLDFACDEVERHIKRDPSVMPDHGGADAGVGLYTVQEVETALKGALAKLGFKESALVAANASAELQNDLGEMLRALGMPDAAQPRSPHEVFQSAIAEMKRQLTNASAEARLREALEPFAALVPSAFDHSYPDDAEIVLVCNGEPHAYLKNINFRRAAAALSSHPHASDCDKQVER